MFKLIRHIEYLLATSQSFTIDNFGYFECKQINAVYDNSTNTLKAPEKKIRFIHRATDEDEILIQTYSQKYSLSIENTRKEIESQINLIKDKLKNHPVEIGIWGNLYSLDNGIVFQQKNNFEKTIFPKISLYKPSKKENIQVKNKNYYYFKIRKGIAELSAAALLLLIFSFLFLLIPVPLSERSHEARLKSYSEISDILKEEKNSEENISLTTVANETENYFLIVATFRSETEANKFISYYEGDKEDLIIVPSKKVTRVCIESSPDKDYLQARLNSNEIRSRFPSAWIWKAE